MADGPLKVAAGHYFQVVLQRPSAGGQADVTYREIEFPMGEAFILTTALLDSHQGWALNVARCSQLLADSDAAGLLDWELRGSIEQVQERLTASVRGLPATARQLDVADVITSTPTARLPDDWWRRMKARALIRSDGSSAVPWHFGPGWHTRSARANAAAKTTPPCLLDILGRGACKDYDSAADGTVAALVAAFMRATRFETGMYVFRGAMEASAEVARRCAESRADRFAPLFDARWRDKNTAISAVLA